MCCCIEWCYNIHHSSENTWVFLGHIDLGQTHHGSLRALHCLQIPRSIQQDEQQYKAPPSLQVFSHDGMYCLTQSCVLCFSFYTIEQFYVKILNRCLLHPNYKKYTAYVVDVCPLPLFDHIFELKCYSFFCLFFFIQCNETRTSIIIKSGGNSTNLQMKQGFSWLLIFIYLNFIRNLTHSGQFTQHKLTVMWVEWIGHQHSPPESSSWWLQSLGFLGHDCVL